MGKISKKFLSLLLWQETPNSDMGLQPNPSKWDASRFLVELRKARSERGALTPFMPSRLAGRNNTTVNKWLEIKEHPLNIFRRHEKAP